MDVSVTSSACETSPIIRLTCRNVLLKRDIRRTRRWYTINVHGFLLHQSPPFTVLLFPFAFLSEHGLQVFSPPIVVFRVIRVLERFRDMEVRELFDESLWTSSQSVRTRCHGERRWDAQESRPRTLQLSSWNHPLEAFR